jgi:hypothetical protein
MRAQPGVCASKLAQQKCQAGSLSNAKKLQAKAKIAKKQRENKRENRKHIGKRTSAKAKIAKKQRENRRK